MPLSPFVEDLLDTLSGLGEMRARAMFGGYGLYHRGLIVGIIDDGVLYLKVDDLTRPNYVSAGCRCFMYPTKQGEIMNMDYWTVPLSVLDSRPAMEVWVKEAYQVSLRAQDARAARKKGKKKKE